MSGVRMAQVKQGHHWWKTICWLRTGADGRRRVNGRVLLDLAVHTHALAAGISTRCARSVWAISFRGPAPPRWAAAARGPRRSSGGGVRACPMPRRARLAARADGHMSRRKAAGCGPWTTPSASAGGPAHPPAWPSPLSTSRWALAKASTTLRQPYTSSSSTRCRRERTAEHRSLRRADTSVERLMLTVVAQASSAGAASRCAGRRWPIRRHPRRHGFDEARSRRPYGRRCGPDPRGRRCACRPDPRYPRLRCCPLKGPGAVRQRQLTSGRAGTAPCLYG